MFNQPIPYELFEKNTNETEHIDPKLFSNWVKFNFETKSIVLTVDVSFDVDYNEFFERENYRRIPAEDIEKQQAQKLALAEKIGDRFSFDFTQQELFCGNLMLSNLFSGTKITYNLGEGLLDFVYADFNFEDAKSVFLKIANEMQTAEITKENIEFFNKAKYQIQSIATMNLTMDSLYSYVFPVEFKAFSEQNFDDLANFIKTLQAEFLSLLQFCFDENFHKSVLGELSAAERFGLYARLFDRNKIWVQSELYAFKISEDNQGKLKENADYKGFSDEIGVDLDEVELMCSLNYESDFSYKCDTILSMLELEFSKMLDADLKLKECANCGKFFITKGNYNGSNCDRIFANNMTCQQVSAIKKHKEKQTNQPALKLYDRYYKRYFARNRIGKISNDDFRRWQYEATILRDECVAGEIEITELEKFLEDSFPNRVRK